MGESNAPTTTTPTARTLPRATNDYSVTKCMLHTEQYRFSPYMQSRMIEIVKNGGWALDYIDMEIIAREYSKMAPSITYSRSLTRSNIKAIYMTFTNDLYKHSKYARKSARYNKGVKKITFRQAGEQYPANTLVEHNSLNSHGKENAQFFYEELTKAMGRNSCDDESVVSLTSFCLDFDSSHMWGLKEYLMSRTASASIFPPNDLQRLLSDQKFDITHIKSNFTDPEWTDRYFSENKFNYLYNSLIDPKFRFLERPASTNFKGDLDNVSSKCIYALNFETMPHSGGLYRGGINTNINVPFIIDVERLLDYDTKDDVWSKIPTVYFLQTIIFETYTTLQLTPSGEFIKV
jgi:hypothetical protein